MALCTASGIDLILTFQQSMPDDQVRKMAHYDGTIQKQTRTTRQLEWTPQDAAHACAGLQTRYFAAFAYRFAGDTSMRRPLRVELLIESHRLARENRWPLVRTCACCLGSGMTDEVRKDPATGLAIKRPDGGWETERVRCQICAAGRVKETPGKVAVVQQLVDLALFEEWLTVHYVTGLLQLAQHELWPGLIGIAEQAWRRSVLDQYRAVQSVLDRWCSTAYGHVSRRLEDRETSPLDRGC